MLTNVNVHKICRTPSLPAWRILRLGGQRFLHAVYITGIYYNFSFKLLLLLLLLMVVVVVVVVVVYLSIVAFGY
jgi:hypothetical protein